MHWRSSRVLGAVIAAALVAVGVAFLSDRPANAATTRHATLAVTGLVADGCPASIGGSQIFIKPGDTVEFDPTLVGIDVGAIKIAGKGLLPGVRLNSSMIASFNSDLRFAGETTTHHLSNPGTASHPAKYRRAFPKSGVYNFGWTAASLTLLPLPVLQALLGNLLTVKFSQNIPGLIGEKSRLSWGGQVVVSDKATQCGLSVQVPGVSIRPSVLGHKLPPVTLPGRNLPTVQAPKLPGTSKSTTKTHVGSTPNGGYLDYTPHGPGVAASVVPKGGDAGGGGGDGGVNGAPGGGDGTQVVTTEVNGKTVKLLVVNGKTVGNARTVDLAARPTDPATKLPMVWVLAALVMLSTATATYARRFIAAKH